MTHYKNLLKNLNSYSTEQIMEQLKTIDFNQLKPDFSQATPLQKEVWQALTAIPAGETRTYSQIASAIHKPKAVRAVASAIAKNQQFYLIPCHRVIRSNGQTGQFRWGQELKHDLLQLEKANNF